MQGDLKGMTDPEILAALQEAKKNGATGIITTPEGAESISRAVELESFTLVGPNRTQRRFIRRITGPSKEIVSPTAAKRRKVRRAIARRSLARNRAR